MKGSDGMNNEKTKMLPTEIKAFLDEYVVGQDRAKKILSVALYNHMKRIRHTDHNIDIEKANVLMIGPSGCGKTHIIKNLARLFNVPYAIADATTLTESGYVGNDVESVLQQLLFSSIKDIDDYVDEKDLLEKAARRAETGIVFIDEIDKKATKAEENMSITRDVSGEGVQQALLKLVEGGDVAVQLNGTRKHPYASTIKINTNNILFICGGAFPGIENIISRRTEHYEKKNIGLKIEEMPIFKEIKGYNDYIDELNTEDLRKYGLIAEFIGRFPIICPMHELSEEELCRILTEPKNSIIKQYKELLRKDEIQIEFEKDALIHIARNAKRNRTGARGLRSQLEKLLLEVMYGGPKKAQNGELSISVTGEDVDSGLIKI